MKMSSLKEKASILVNHKAVTNGMWLYLLQLFNSVIPLITLPYVTRILGKEMFGLFSIAINIIGYLQVITEYGFIMSATRKVIYLEGNKRKLDVLFTSVICSRVILLIPCILFSIVYLYINRSQTALCQGYLLLLTGLIGYCLQMSWLFQGKQDMKYISIISIISRIISLIIIFMFVKTENDLPLYCIAYSATPIISGIFGIILAGRKYDVRFVKASINQILKELRDGWFVFTTQLSTTVFSSIGITFLGMFAAAAEVGTYSAIQKIPNIILLIWAPISQVMYPISSGHMKNSISEGVAFVLKYRKRILALFSIIALAIAVSGKYVIALAFGAAYAERYYWIYPLLLWLVVSINNNFWGIQILLGSGHDKEYSKCFQLGVLATVCFNYVFIRFLGGNGAAVAPLLAESVLGLLLWIEVRKIQKVEYNNE